MNKQNYKKEVQLSDNEAINNVKKTTESNKLLKPNNKNVYREFFPKEKKEKIRDFNHNSNNDQNIINTNE